jgi:hypothetical protein
MKSKALPRDVRRSMDRLDRRPGRAEPGEPSARLAPRKSPAASLVLVMLLWAGPALAQEAPGAPSAPPPRVALRLEYIRGTGTLCPDEHVAADMLHGEVTYEADPYAELHLVVEATRQGREHRVSVVMRDGNGAALWSRVHQARDCADALESGMVSTALELGGAEQLREREARQRAAPAAVPPPIVVAPPLSLPLAVVPPPPPLAVPARPPFDLLLGADALLVVGSTPGPALGAGVFVEVRPAGLPELSVEVTGRAAWTITATQEGFVPVRSAFYAAQLAVCGHVGWASFCPMIGVGGLEHHALSVGTGVDATRPFAILGARVGAEHRLARRFLVRGFIELDGLPGGAEIQLRVNEEWRASVGCVAGIGIALQP